MRYNYISDEQPLVGFLSKQEILSFVTEEQVFSLVFGYEPIELEYVTSPFRPDITPNCYFERMSQNRLRFKDHSRKFYPDCFDAVRVFFNIKSFYDTLSFINDKLIRNKPVTRHTKRYFDTEINRINVIIDPMTRAFTSNDAKFWQPYGITRESLIEDKVFAVTHVAMYNTKKGDISFDVNELCYLYNEFKERKKLYFPTRETNKFLSSCKGNDIGCYHSIPTFGKQLIITKSYKDCRVIKNTARVSVWFQSEGTLPSIERIIEMCKRFTNIIILYDNDIAGMKAAMDLRNLINSIFPRKARAIWLPEELNTLGISDSSDLVKIRSYNDLNSFFDSNMI